MDDARNAKAERMPLWCYGVPMPAGSQHQGKYCRRSTGGDRLRREWSRCRAPVRTRHKVRRSGSALRRSQTCQSSGAATNGEIPDRDGMGERLLVRLKREMRAVAICVSCDRPCPSCRATGAHTCQWSGQCLLACRLACEARHAAPPFASAPCAVSNAVRSAVHVRVQVTDNSLHCAPVVVCRSLVVGVVVEDLGGPGSVDQGVFDRVQRLKGVALCWRCRALAMVNTCLAILRCLLALGFRLEPWEVATFPWLAFSCIR